MEDPQLTVMCRQVVELVTDYLEGALPPELGAAVDEHLAACPPCVEYVEQIRLTAASLGAVPEDSIAPERRAELVAAFKDLVPPRGADS